MAELRDGQDWVPGRRVGAGDESVLAGWQSLAQWFGTKQGSAAIAEVAEVWPGYERHAGRSSLNAYYTDVDVIATVWNWLEDAGVESGHGFEPGVGRGDWIELAPSSMTFDAVDIDPVTVEVARWRTGAQVVECPIEEWHVGRSSRSGEHGYDVVVGNVPFAAYRPAVNNPHRDNLHNLSIGRSIDMLRPGGIAVVLTSRYTLDSKSDAFRRRLADDVDLVAAYRLPTGTHREAGTNVVTDMLVLRRPLPDETRPTPGWLDTATHDVDGVELRWNHYFDDHPDHVLGTVEPGGAYRADDFSVRSARPAHEALAEQLAHAPSLDYRPAGRAPADAAAVVRTATGRELPVGSIVVDPTSDTGFARDGDPYPCARSNVAQLAALCGLRDAALDYLDDPSEEGRVELADLYDAYRADYPPLNSYRVVNTRSGDGDGEAGKSIRRYPRLEGFRSDPSWWNVAALEDFDDDTMQARPAALLVRDTLTAETRWPESAATITQAAVNSLSRHHCLDVDYIADQLDIDPAGVEEQLATIAYRLPEGGWELTDRYLAGDVVAKLDQAREAAEHDPAFERNVAALTEALPTPLTAAEISAEFGAPWLEPAEIQSFLRAHGGGNPTINYHRPTGEWSHNGAAVPGPDQFHRARRSMVETVIAMCNGKPATVWTEIEVGDSRRRIVDVDATSAEQLARDNLTEALQGWVWSDPERTETLVARYNRMFNRHVAETWDGSHLTLPGLATSFEPRPHQKDVVWRILASSDSGTLMSHGVGAGKTAAMVIAGAEARRTGRVQGTTLYAVPGNMVEQFARDYLALYPGARIVTPVGSNMTEATRQFAARVATGDFDAAICSHNVLKSIPLSPALETAALQSRIAEFEQAPTENLSRGAAKRAARRLASLEEKLKAVKDAAEDPGATYFDRMGVGMMFVDEAHLAKNIVLGTDRQGLPIPEGSQVAEAVLARADHVRDRNGHGAVVMATATPVTNSPAEMWVMGRLIAPDALARAGIDRFDPFAANFLAPVDTVELDAGGRLRVVTRLGEYRNFPDLARLFRSFADVRPTNTLGFELPTVHDGGAIVHAVPPTDQQLVAADWASERADRQHLDTDAADHDPAIAIMSMSKMAALHPACVSNDITRRWATRSHPNLTFDWDEPNHKLIELADTVAEIHTRTGDWTYPNSSVPGAAQVIFCDWGTPNRGRDESVYQIITDLLTDRGVAREEIAWVHDIANPAKRQPLWDAVRSGHTRILLGSTAQMGVGVNIQTRLYATHEVTTPASGRPDGLEQAEGRMIRQGNQHTTVELHRYITERTADANGWQMLQRKQHFITQAMSDPDTLTRDLRDESVVSPAEEFAQIAAIATGDPRHVQLAALTATVTRLERAERAHHTAHTNQQRTTGYLTSRVTTLTNTITTLEQLDPATIDDTAAVGRQLLELRGGRHQLTVAGVTFDIERSYDEMTITIAGTHLRPNRLDRNALDPHDHGRGAGTRIANMIDKIPTRINETRRDLTEAQTQLDAIQAQPVPDTFPRRDELHQARTERDRLRTELIPQPDTTPETATAEIADTGHPVWGHDEPTEAAKASWAGSFRHYDPNRHPYIGNRAKADRWLPWIKNHLATNAHNIGTRHDIGICRGVALTATICDNNQVRIETRHSLAKRHTWPHHTTNIDDLTLDDLDTWLRHNADTAHTLRPTTRRTVDHTPTAARTHER